MRPHYCSSPDQSWPAAAMQWSVEMSQCSITGGRCWCSCSQLQGSSGVTVECDNTPSLVMGLLMPHSSHWSLSSPVTPPVRILINSSSHNSSKSSPSLLTADYEPEKKEMFQVLWAESLLIVENILTLKIF